MFKFNVTKVARLTRNFYGKRKKKHFASERFRLNSTSRKAREKMTLKVLKINFTIFYFKLQALLTLNDRKDFEKCSLRRKSC